MQAIDGAPCNRAALVTCLSRVYFAGWPGFFFLQLRPSLPPHQHEADDSDKHKEHVAKRNDGLCVHGNSFREAART